MSWEASKCTGNKRSVVTVKCGYRAVSFTIGIVGVIYEVSTFGGARIATIAGILSSGQRKGPWANITPQLTTIRDAILAGAYNNKDSAPKCSIQEVHQLIV